MAYNESDHTRVEILLGSFKRSANGDDLFPAHQQGQCLKSFDQCSGRTPKSEVQAELTVAPAEDLSNVFESMVFPFFFTPYLESRNSVPGVESKVHNYRVEFLRHMKTVFAAVDADRSKLPHLLELLKAMRDERVDEEGRLIPEQNNKELFDSNSGTSLVRCAFHTINALQKIQEITVKRHQCSKVESKHLPKLEQQSQPAQAGGDPLAGAGESKAGGDDGLPPAAEVDGEGGEASAVEATAAVTHDTLATFNEGGDARVVAVATRIMTQLQTITASMQQDEVNFYQFAVLLFIFDFHDILEGHLKDERLLEWGYLAGYVKTLQEMLFAAEQDDIEKLPSRDIRALKRSFRVYAGGLMSVVTQLEHLWRYKEMLAELGRAKQDIETLGEAFNSLSTDERGHMPFGTSLASSDEWLATSKLWADKVVDYPIFPEATFDHLEGHKEKYKEFNDYLGVFVGDLQFLALKCMPVLEAATLPIKHAFPACPHELFEFCNKVNSSLGLMEQCIHKVRSLVGSVTGDAEVIAKVELLLSKVGMVRQRMQVCEGYLRELRLKEPADLLGSDFEVQVDAVSSLLGEAISAYSEFHPSGDASHSAGGARRPATRTHRAASAPLQPRHDGGGAGQMSPSLLARAGATGGEGGGRSPLAAHHMHAGSGGGQGGDADPIAAAHAGIAHSGGVGNR